MRKDPFSDSFTVKIVRQYQTTSEAHIERATKIRPFIEYSLSQRDSATTFYEQK